MKRFLKTVVLLLLLAALGAGSVVWYQQRANGQPSVFRTAVVKRGDLVATISATGTVEPEDVVDVGARVAGEITTFGKDKAGKEIDFGSVVEEGMVLVNIDDTLYATDVASATAQIQLGEGQLLHANAEVETSAAAVQASEAAVQASAAAVQADEAGVAKAEADLRQMQAKLVQAKNDWDRAQKLGMGEALSETQYDAYRAAYETAKANVGVAEAAILQAKAAVLQAKATVLQSKSAVAQAQGALSQSKSAVAQANAQIAQAKAGETRARRNLTYCTIKSPVQGTIIARRVNVGQTVVASLNAPSLFLIAKDLKRMEVWVSVNEADIGQIHAGQPVAFTVDAYPGEVFQGQVGRVRLDATMTQNVVTYPVEVTTDNSKGKLLPYLTANVQFEIRRLTGVLLVPNAALRWMPQPDQVAPEHRALLVADTGRSAGPSGERPSPARTSPPAAPGGEGSSPVRPAPASGAAIERPPSARPPTATSPGDERPPEARAASARSPSARRSAVVWVRQGNLLRPVSVRPGLSDGLMTAVQSDELKEDTEVVIGEQRPGPGNTADTTTNPFAPQMPFRKRN